MSVEREVVVVGGGLAGMSAALASARLGRQTLLVTGGVPGGQLVSINKIEGVPGFAEGVPGYDLCPIAQEQASAAGVEFSMGACESLLAADDRWRVTSADGEWLARAVVFASGTERATLGVPGEERLAGKGVSHCASCDAPLLRNQTVVVVGGGDSGMQEALTLSEHVAKVILLEKGPALGGQPYFRQLVEAQARIEPRLGVTVMEILGDSGVTHVRTRRLDGGAEEAVPASAVFACTGLIPNTRLVSSLLALDASGRIHVDAAMRSSARGICAAGNVRAGSPHRAAAAMGDGATAAEAIDRYLHSGRWRDPE